MGAGRRGKKIKEEVRMCEKHDSRYLEISGTL
jgi:hypothetical protein